MLIATQIELDGLCESLSAAKQLFIDTEFVRERTYYSQLCLLQIAGEVGDVFVVDMLAELDYCALFALINQPNVTKIMHACRQDVEILFQQTGAMPTPLYDTQIAAIFLGLGEQIGYAGLIEHFLQIKLCKTQQYTNWALRPLSEAQLSYAKDDVVHLREVFPLLQAELERLGRIAWAMEEMQIIQNPAWIMVGVDDLWRRIKRRSDNSHYLARLQALSIWREEEAVKANLNRSKIMLDDVLQEIALQNPANPENLRKIKGVNGRIDCALLLEVMERANNLSLNECPTLPAFMRLNEVEELKRDSLRLLLKLVAKQAAISSSMLCNSDEMQRLATAENIAEVLHGWRYEMFGRLAEQFLNGNVAIKYMGIIYLK
jgi:ribonuclease D